MIFSRDHVRRGDQEYQKGNLQRAAELYLKAKRYRQAASVFAELGDIRRAVAVYVDAGQPRMAAELLAAEGQYKEAISKYEEAGAFARAAEICLKLQQLVRAGRLFEQAKMYRRSAEAFTQAGEIERALGALEAANKSLRSQRRDTKDLALEKKIRELDTHRAEVLSNVGRHLEAAELMAEHRQIARAASLYERAGHFSKAAEAFLGAGRVTEALTAIERAPEADEELRAEIYLNCARHQEAGEIFERMGRFDAAASAYEGAEAWEEAARLWEKAESFGRAAEFFWRIERYEDAGRCYAKADRHDQAAKAFGKAGDDQFAADAYMAAGNLLLAGEHYVKAGLQTAAREALQSISASSQDYQKASCLLIPVLIEEGLLKAAEQRFDLLGSSDIDPTDPALLYCQGRLEEARGRYPAAELSYQKILAKHHDYFDVNERLRDIRGKVGNTSSVFEASQPGNREPTEPMPRTALRDTAPIAFESPTQVSRAAGTRSTPTTPPVTTPQPSAPHSSSPHSSAPHSSTPLSPSASSALPFDLGDRIDPWWSGAEFFRAVDHRTRKPILLVSFPLAEVASRIEKFRRVMREVVALDHPTILKLDEVIMASDKVLLLYEPFDGTPLGSLLATQRMPPLTNLNFVVQLTEALSTAHKLGVTHQWISPRTILVDDNNRLKLVGIGLRDVLADRDATSQAYLSPEILEDGVIGPASDVYSLGLLAVELLQAQMPVGWSDQPEVDPKTVVWPDEVREAVPPMARDVLVRALARQPLTRPSTLELTSALSSIGLVPGQILVNRYEILGELGQGGMSRVYRARDRDLDDEVAIKTVLTPALGHSENEERLLREVQICRKISHPNVVRVHDFGRFPGGIFIIMEILDGPGLDLVIANEAPLPIDRVKKMLQGIAGALSEAHRLKIIHRDLKPSNVILVDDRVKVLDFGIARMGDGSESVHLTRTGEVIGSPMYMAPEQIQGQSLTGSCDLYALGVIAYTLLAGREPFIADTTTAVVLKHLHDTPPDVRDARPDLPDEWVDLLAKLLAKKPADRYSDAEQLVDTLATLPT
ncbi:MAG: protein kinase [Acidobacteriota bacterium]